MPNQNGKLIKRYISDKKKVQKEETFKPKAIQGPKGPEKAGNILIID